ncbi:MAG: hypothetical protein KDC71_24445, partial [Acidobacteria bacterium]|nr:hypothetical protein [Acidobacteriota bacterium]
MRFLLLFLVFPHCLAQQEPIKVRYLAEGKVYLDAGADRQLQVGDTVLIRQGAIRLIVEAVNSRTSLCRLEAGPMPEIGEVCQWVKPEGKPGDAAVQEPDAVQAEPVESGPSPPKSMRERAKKPLRGSVALEYAAFQSDLGEDRAQQGLRINLRSTEDQSGSFSFRIRTRTRFYDETPFRVERNLERTENRIYVAYVEQGRPDARFHWALGRILDADAASLGPVDGLRGRVTWGQGHGFSFLGGLQPEWEYSKFSSDIQKYGMVYTFDTPKAKVSSGAWHLAIGAMGEYLDGEVNREYVTIQNRYQGTHLGLFQSLEWDVNRDWRKDVTGKSSQLTNLFLRADWRTGGLRFGLQYDTRKNVRTYELLTEQEQYFDDLFRRGLRATLSYKWSRHDLIYLNVGQREREDGSEDATTFNLRYNRTHFFHRQLGFNVSGSQFQNGLSDGHQWGAEWTWQIPAGGDIRLGYTVSAYDYLSQAMQRENNWLTLAC